MAGPELSPGPSNWLLVLLMLLSGTAPFDEDCWFYSLSLFPLVPSPALCTLLALSLSASCLLLTATLGPGSVGTSQADRLRALQPQPLSGLQVCGRARHVGLVVLTAEEPDQGGREECGSFTEDTTLGEAGERLVPVRPWNIHIPEMVSLHEDRRAL